MDDLYDVPGPAGEGEEQKRRWGQRRRLLFIDRRLRFEGRVNRRDLTAFFDISTPQASQDLRRYEAAAPGNMAYSTTAKAFEPTKAFVPLTGEPDARAYLLELHALETGVIHPSESFVGFRPPVGTVASPSRPLDARVVAFIIQAIRDKKAVSITYQSMRDTAPKRRVISPHAVACDGLRWHVRAFCHLRQSYRDFAIGRAEWERPVEEEYVGDERDSSWHTTVAVLLAPHPALSPSQRAFVEHDYGIPPGAVLEVSCRQAMVFYTLRHLNLFDLNIDSDPARQHVVVVNCDDVRRWMDETG